MNILKAAGVSTVHARVSKKSRERRRVVNVSATAGEERTRNLEKRRNETDSTASHLFHSRRARGAHDERRRQESHPVARPSKVR